MKQIYLEACVGSVACGQMASALGVNRLEFCANLEIGGTTPSLASFPLLKAACHANGTNNAAYASGIHGANHANGEDKAVGVTGAKHSNSLHQAPSTTCAIHVLIRPRAGDFLYSDQEFATMLAEITQFKAMGADGIVLGILTPEGTLDAPRMAQAMDAAGGLPVTLHRAFDMTQDVFATLDLAAQLGIATVLTSGQAPDALQGILTLRQLQEYSAGRVEIMACGGINAEKIAPIYQQAGVTTFHMAGLQLCESEMKYRNPTLSMGSKAFDEYTLRKASPALFAAAVQARDGLNQG